MHVNQRFVNKLERCNSKIFLWVKVNIFYLSIERLKPASHEVSNVTTRFILLYLKPKATLHFKHHGNISV